MKLAKIILILFSAFFSTTSIAENQVVRVIANTYPSWAEGKEGEQSTPRIAVDVAQELFQRLGRKTQVNIYPFKRGMDRIKHGEEDVILMVSETDERKEYMLFTTQIRRVEFVLFHPVERKRFVWNEWADLAQFNIGVVSGQYMGEEWSKAIATYSLNVEEAKSDAFNIKKLLQGRVDFIVADKEMIQRIIEKNSKYQRRLTWSEKPVYVSEKNLGISKKSQLASVMPTINATLQEMKDDGTFQKIFCTYKKSFSGSCESN